VTKKSNSDASPSALDSDLPRRLENQMGMIENIIAGMESAAEAMAAIGSGSDAAGLEWAAGKLGEDVMHLQEAFESLRDLVYATAPAAKAEAARQAGIKAKALGKTVPAN